MNAFICLAGHVTPQGADEGGSIRCRFRVGSRMECSRPAYLLEHDPCDCGAPYLPGRPFQCVHEYERAVRMR